MKLKPCPFCGCARIIESRNFDDPPFCSKCYATGPMLVGLSVDLNKEWNRRFEQNDSTNHLESMIMKMWLSRKPCAYTKRQYAENPTCNWESRYHAFCEEAAKIFKRRMKK